MSDNIIENKVSYKVDIIDKSSAENTYLVSFSKKAESKIKNDKFFTINISLSSLGKTVPYRIIAMDSEKKVLSVVTK